MVSLQVALTALAVAFSTAAIIWRRIKHRGHNQFSPEAAFARSVSEEIPEDVKRHFMFWGGAIAGMISAAVTHFLDVLKILRHVGKPTPRTWSGYLFGMPMGSFAQGERFAATLVLNATLQRRLARWEQAATRHSTSSGGSAFKSRIVSFLFSIIAAGAAEFLSNPPVVVKNYQIANGVSFPVASYELWKEGGIPRFFSGVSMGVLRKSLANAIVLQTIGPVKQMLSPSIAPFVGDADQRKVILGFVAGSVTGGLAEVLTNHPDQVKTLTQTGMGFAEALLLASRNPFRGALWAGLRKGVIRGINWGGLAFCTAIFQRAYFARRAVKTYDLEAHS